MVTSIFSFSRTVFYPSTKQISVFQSHLFCCLQICDLERFKKLSFGKDLTLPNDKILGVTKLKAFADDKINVSQLMNFACERIENIVGKGNKAPDKSE